MDATRLLLPFDNGELTSFFDNQLLQLNPVTMQDDYEKNILKLTENLIEINERKAFLEGIALYLGDFSVDDTEGMLKEVQRRYADKGIALPKAVKVWFQKSDVSPSIKQDHRRNLYDFCVAMGMDYITTAEFFLKSFLTIPFNYKDRIDAVYFYCMKTGRPYEIIKKMLATAESFEATNPEVSSTEFIGKHILDIETDEEFLHYLRFHCFDSNHQYETTKNKIIHLIGENKKIVPGRDRNGNELPFQDLGTTKNSVLLDAILNFRYQSLDASQRKNMKDSGLPMFPRDGDISNITSGSHDVSSEVLRKTLILMQFYNVFRSKQRERKWTATEDLEEIQGDLWDFIDTTDGLLAECGFVQLYSRNPYDAIILFCANSPDPILHLQTFIQKRYMKNLED